MIFRYDSRFERLDTYAGDVRIIGFFQSWKYFRDVRACIVKEFTFRRQFQSTADNFMRNIADKHQYVEIDLYYITNCQILHLTPVCAVPARDFPLPKSTCL